MTLIIKSRSTTRYGNTKDVHLKRHSKIGRDFREISQYIKHLALWARTHFAPTITFFTSIVFGVGIILHFDFSEQSIIVVGLLFQFFGLVPVAFGIREAMRVFDHPTPWAAAKEAWRTRPRWRPPPTTGVGHVTMGGVGAAAGVGQAAAVSAERSIAERVESLERMVEQIKTAHSQLETKVEGRFSSIKKDLDAAKNEHKANIEEISRKVKSINIDGIGWAIAGLGWIALGITLSAVSGLH